MRLSPLDPFFGMELVRPLLESEAAADSLARSTRYMAIDIVEVCAIETTACVDLRYCVFQDILLIHHTRF